MRRLLLATVVVGLAAAAACREEPSGSSSEEAEPAPSQAPEDDPLLRPPTARWTQVEELRADLVAQRHPADGGGSGVIVTDDGAPATGVAREPGRWRVRYTAGPLGVAAGGGVYFMPEPFWGWSSPQSTRPGRLGYTTVMTGAEGVELEVRDLGPMLVAVIGGRALVEGEAIEFDYGAGGAGALADVQAERAARLWLAVDGDGDGVRKVVADSPTIAVAPGPVAMLSMTVTSVARPGETARLTVAALDAYANTGVAAEGLEVRLGRRPQGWELPETVTLGPAGRAALEFTCHEVGVLRLLGSLALEDGSVLEAESNPLWISPDAPRVRWVDLHGHSGLSDGTGTPEDYFRYARDVAGLDGVALTDHDHFGVQFLDQTPELWDDIRAQNAAFHEPGRFVTVLGYEWTSWIHGHRHVLYFADEGPLHSWLDPQHETPQQLWDALRERPALTLAHHPAGEPIPVNWAYAPDPHVEPLVEVVSVHGSSEAPTSPRVVRGARRGHYVRDALDRGYRLGLIGSGDSHDGHPGLAHRSPMYGARGPGPNDTIGTSGLAAVYCDELNRESLLLALRARRAYATSGPRTIVLAELTRASQGNNAPTDDPEAALDLTVIADGALAHLDVIRPGQAEARLPLEGVRSYEARIPLEGLQADEYVYLRIEQTNGGLVFTSPIFGE